MITDAYGETLTVDHQSVEQRLRDRDTTLRDLVSASTGGGLRLRYRRPPDLSQPSRYGSVGPGAST